MPLGLWKSKWEIHREDMDRYREETRQDRARSDERWTELREETRVLRADYERELVEGRLFNRELLIRLEKTYGNLGSTMEMVGDELRLLGEEVVTMRLEIHELKDAVNSQTEAILRLVDRFEGTDGRPPV